jgi:nickel-dependent lactate racemase
MYDRRSETQEEMTHALGEEGEKERTFNCHDDDVVVVVAADAGKKRHVPYDVVTKDLLREWREGGMQKRGIPIQDRSERKILYQCDVYS